jgi:uncharacterized membrane protein
LKTNPASVLVTLEFVGGTEVLSILNTSAAVAQANAAQRRSAVKEIFFNIFFSPVKISYS